MNLTFSKIAYWKQVDAVLQIIVFTWSVFMSFFSTYGIWLLMSLALLQIISCVIWSFYFDVNKGLRYRAGGKVRKAFFIILITGLSSAALELAITLKGLFLFFLFLMLILGPIMGVLYFIITCKEYMYYKNHFKSHS